LLLEYDETLLIPNLGIYIEGVGWIGQYNSYYWEQEAYGVDKFVRDYLNAF